ncbi:MAG: aminopeptidase P family N-terminal domain-containing protein, partial [Planctomycetota bacterium]
MNVLKVLYSASEIDNDLYYVSGFLAPDPFLFVELNGRKIIFLSDLEYERGKREAKVDEVVRITPLIETLKKTALTVSPVDILLLWLQHKGIKKEGVRVEIPPNFSASL